MNGFVLLIFAFVLKLDAFLAALVPQNISVVLKFDFVIVVWGHSLKRWGLIVRWS